MSRKQTYYWFIELLANWQGEVNSQDLVAQFAVSKAQAKRHLADYQQTCPSNLQYSPSFKKFVPSQTFACLYGANHVGDYFTWLESGLINPQSDGGNAFLETVRSEYRYVSPSVMRPLMRAIKTAQRLEVDYVSMENPTSVGRVIQPHSIVRTSQRWHVRAFDEFHGDFRDYVVSRFRGEPELSGPATHTKEHDTAWRTQLEIKLAPDPRLTEAQQHIIATDYAMHDGQLVIPCRAALAQYVLDELHIKTRFHEPNPVAQQLVVTNFDAIKPWLFNA